MSPISHIQNIAGLALGIGAAIIGVQWLYALFFGPINHVPGPLYTRFTKLVYKYYSIKGQRTRYIHSLHLKYGSVVRVAPDEVSISDLPAVKEIHRVSTPFHKSNWYFHFTGRQKRGLFTTPDPHYHRARRSLLAHSLSVSGLKPMEPTIRENIQKTMDGMVLENSQKGTADIFKWYMYMATDVVGELAFAESFKMLDKVEPNQYYDDLKNLGILSGYRTELGDWAYVLAALRIDPFHKGVGLVHRLTHYAESSFARFEKHLEENPDNPKPTLFGKLLSKEADGQLTREDAIREGVSYIAAGSDTAAVVSTYVAYCVCKHPHVRKQLLEELETLSDEPSWDELAQLPYLNRVIQETLRLYSAASASLKRDVPPTGAKLAGYSLPYGIIVSTQAYTIHRNPEIFPDPEKFDPDRWLKPTPEMNQAYMPYGGGTRICIGMHLGNHQLQMATFKFFRRFPNATILETDAAMDQEAYFLMAPKAHRCLTDLGLNKPVKA